MENILTSAAALQILSLLIPGIIIVFVRSRFLSGQFPKSSEAILPCVVVGILYFASIGVAISGLTFGAKGQIVLFGWYAQLFVFPAIIGMVLGIIADQNYFGKIARYLNLSIVTPHPSVWDAIFSNYEEQWVIVTLTDKSKVGGYLKEGSHLSSNPTERDIYISQVWKIPSRGAWKRISDGGIYIAANHIQTIELFPNHKLED
jgi:hypothetical protein